MTARLEENAMLERQRLLLEEIERAFDGVELGEGSAKPRLSITTAARRNGARRGLSTRSTTGTG